MLLVLYNCVVLLVPYDCSNLQIELYISAYTYAFLSQSQVCNFVHVCINVDIPITFLPIFVCIKWLHKQTQTHTYLNIRYIGTCAL